MSATPKSIDNESLNGSWVELCTEAKESLSNTPQNVNLQDPVKNLNLKAKVEKLLADAQKDIKDATSESISPVTPRSPLYEQGSVSIIEAMLMNKDDLIERSQRIPTDWLWDWPARVTHSNKSSPCPNEWQSMMDSQCSKKLTLRQWAVRKGFLSKDILSVLLFSNLFSLVLGAGIGYTVLIKKSL